MSDLTAEQLETGRRNLLSQLRHDLKRDLSEYPVDAATMRDLVEVLEGLAPEEEPERLWPADAYPEHMMAAEPVGVSDEAVEALSRALIGPAWGTFDEGLRDTMRGIHRAALEAAQPFMQPHRPTCGTTYGESCDGYCGPQVVASRERVEQVVRRVYIDGGATIRVAQEGAADIVSALLAAGVFREPPTREQIARMLHDMDERHPWLSESCIDHECGKSYDRYADAVLALMGGAE